MREIEEAISKLKTNRPIFNVKLSNDYDGDSCITFTLTESIDRSVKTGDPILDAVNERYSEYLNARERKFEVAVNASSVYNNVVFQLVRSVYVRNSLLKEPKLSKIYRFLKTLYNTKNKDMSNAMISLYKHLLKVVDDKYAFVDGKDGENAKQFNHIMSKLTERYSVK